MRGRGGGNAGKRGEERYDPSHWESSLLLLTRKIARIEFDSAVAPIGKTLRRKLVRRADIDGTHGSIRGGSNKGIACNGGKRLCRQLWLSRDAAVRIEPQVDEYDELLGMRRTRRRVPALLDLIFQRIAQIHRHRILGTEAFARLLRDARIRGLR